MFAPVSSISPSVSSLDNWYTEKKREREKEGSLIIARAAVLIRVDCGVIIRELDTKRTRLFRQLGTEKVSRTRREISFTRRCGALVGFSTLACRRERTRERARVISLTKYFIICNYNSCAVNFHSCEPRTRSEITPVPCKMLTSCLPLQRLRSFVPVRVEWLQF